MKNKEDLVRINKFLSESGVCSRRASDASIINGDVLINGKVAVLGDKVSYEDEVYFKGVLVSNKIMPIYIAFNKPIGVTCTTDSRIRSNIISYINHKDRIFPIGRLDRDSEGLILLTNDGNIVNKILRSKNNNEKEYLVKVNKPITNDFLNSLSNGVNILGIRTNKCHCEKFSEYEFKIILKQGLNRQIRRMCDIFGYEVSSLKRIRIMNIHLDDLKIGAWRNLSSDEVLYLNELLSSSSNM